jgi:hypothetical protein
MAHQEPAITLRRDSQYTVEVQLSVGEYPDRCIYKITVQTWLFDALPREFKCSLPEDVMFSTFSTRRDPLVLNPVVPDRLSIVVNEYDVSSRQRVATLFERTYIVEWR